MVTAVTTWIKATRQRILLRERHSVRTWRSVDFFTCSVRANLSNLDSPGSGIGTAAEVGEGIHTISSHRYGLGYSEGQSSNFFVMSHFHLREVVPDDYYPLNADNKKWRNIQGYTLVGERDSRKTGSSSSTAEQGRTLRQIENEQDASALALALVRGPLAAAGSAYSNTVCGK
jgi:hypothetical protein